MLKSRTHIVHDRQIRLANIRTFLAFFRTAIACWGLGMALFHLISLPSCKILGLISIGIGWGILVWGIAEYHFVQKNYIHEIAEHNH